MSAPSAGRALGVDLGRRRIGVALSNSGRTMASPYATLAAPGSGDDAEATAAALATLVEETAATVVVVGLPLSLDGRRGPAAEAAEAVAAALSRRLGADGAPVVLHDERLTTVAAEQALAQSGRRARHRRPVVDQAAATVLLQSWLDGQRADRWRPVGAG
jgi:putative Holliday junction resolvase